MWLLCVHNCMLLICSCAAPAGCSWFSQHGTLYPSKNVSLSDRFSKKPLASSTFFGSFFSVDLGILFRTFTHPIRIQRAASDRTLSYFLQLSAAAIDTLGSYRFYWCQLCHASASLLYISCVTCISIPVSYMTGSLNNVVSR